MQNTVRATSDVDLARTDQTTRELKRGALLNTVALIVANFRGIFTFLVARLLGPVALGIFSVAWATTDLLAKIGIFGLDDAITTFIARAGATGDRARAAMLFRRAVGLVLVQSTIFTVLAVSFVRLFGDRLGLERDLVSALSLLLCTIPAIALYRVCTSVSRGMKVMEHDIYSRGITDSTATTIAFLIALGIGLRNSAPQIAAMIGMIASAIVALILAAGLFRGTKPQTQKSSRGESQRLLAYAAPISAYQFLNAFILRLDLIMLAWFIDRAPGVTLTTVGVYSAVVDLASSSRKVNQAFYPIFAPVVAGMTATGEHARAADTYGRLAQWMLWILLPIVAVLILAGGPILLIYGPAFEQGAIWLAIVTIACATNAFIGLGETVIMVQRPHLNLLHSSIASVIAVGANLLLIPRFGVTGAAFGILVPYLVQGFLRFTALRFVFRWPSSWSKIAPPVIAAAIAAIPAIVCRVGIQNLAGQIAAGAVFLVIFGIGWQYHSHSRS